MKIEIANAMLLMPDIFDGTEDAAVNFIKSLEDKDEDELRALHTVVKSKVSAGIQIQTVERYIEGAVGFIPIPHVAKERLRQALMGDALFKNSLRSELAHWLMWLSKGKQLISMFGSHFIASLVPSNGRPPERKVIEPIQNAKVSQQPVQQPIPTVSAEQREKDQLLASAIQIVAPSVEAVAKGRNPAAEKIQWAQGLQQQGRQRDATNPVFSEEISQISKNPELLQSTSTSTSAVLRPNGG
jgi:hypothetical protein